MSCIITSMSPLLNKLNLISFLQCRSQREVRWLERDLNSHVLPLRNPEGASSGPGRAGEFLLGVGSVGMKTN